MTSYYVIVLITAGLVTWLPRISPFVLVRFGKLPNWLAVFATIPTLLTIWRTKSIMWTVLVGIISMAFLRAI